MEGRPKIESAWGGTGGRKDKVRWRGRRAAQLTWGWKSGGGSLGTTSPTRPERRRRPNWRRESTGAIIRWYRLAERVRCGDATGGEWRLGSSEPRGGTVDNRAAIPVGCRAL